jgi:hypothetical protein
MNENRPSPPPTASHVEAVVLRPTNEKCCSKCAFRAGSPERSDPWQWMRMAEASADGDTFYCHESVPNHPLEVVDDRPRFRVCAGRAALDGKDFLHLGFQNVDILR